MTTYVIDKRYKTQVERSERVLEIAEAFGIGLDDKEFVVFDNLKVEINKGDVVYITGQSGSGKSTILRELTSQMKDDGLKVAVIDEVEIEQIPLVDSLSKAKSTKEALDALSVVGLTDAYLFVRKPQELSDGQLYRFKLAKLIESGADVWVADEFLAVLDRDTAKVIAYNIQRIARKLGVTVLVATTHQDMVQDLAPSLTINKRFREKVQLITDITDFDFGNHNSPQSEYAYLQTPSVGV